MNGGYIIPAGVEAELYDYWFEPSPFIRPLTPEEAAARAERVRQMNRPWPRIVRWFRGLRWEAHERLFPECHQDDY